MMELSKSRAAYLDSTVPGSTRIAPMARNLVVTVVKSVSTHLVLGLGPTASESHHGRCFG